MIPGNRSTSFLAGCGWTSLLLAGAVPAAAQPVRVENQVPVQFAGMDAQMDVFDAKMREAIAARAAGNCIAHQAALNDAQNYLNELWEPRRWDNLELQFQAPGYYDRVTAARALIASERGAACGSTPPGDATMADFPAAGPLGRSLAPDQQPRDRSRILAAEQALDIAGSRCDRRAWEAAHRDLLQALRDYLAAGDDAAMRIMLRNTEARTVPANCPPPPPDLEGTLTGGLQAAVFFSGGIGDHAVPRANYGFNRDGPSPAPDVPAAYSDDRLLLILLQAGIRLPNAGRFSVSYGEGSTSNRTDLPVSTNGGSQGTVNTDNAPSGSTGGAANRGLNVTTETEVSEFGADFRYPFLRGPRREPEERRYPYGPITVSAGYVEVSADYRDREHSGVVDIPGVPAGTPPVIRQVLDQQVTELELGVSVGFEFLVPISDDARITLGVQGGVKYYDYNLDSLQTNTQLVGGPQDLNFTLEIEDDETGISYHGDAIAELSFDLSRSLQFFVQGQVSYDSARAQINNPFSGTFVQNGGTTFLGTDDAVDFATVFGFRIALDWDR